MPIKAEDSIIRPVTSFLFKGHNGTGKTIAACGQKFRPVYVFNCEGRFESVLTYYKKYGNLKDIEYDNFPIGSGYFNLDQRFDKLIANCPYQTVVMSSLTSFIYLILNHLIKDAFGKKNAKGYDAGKRIGGIPVNQLPDFNAEDSAIINDLIAGFQQLKAQGVTVILEAHITPYEITSIEEGGRVTTTINQILTKGKKAPASVPGFFNEIYLFEKTYEGIVVGQQQSKFSVNTGGTPTDDCKSSWGIKSFDWTNQDFSELLFSQLSEEIKETSRVDPNAPKVVTF